MKRILYSAIVCLILTGYGKGLPYAGEGVSSTRNPSVLGMDVDGAGIWRDVVFDPHLVKRKVSAMPSDNAAVHHFLQQYSQELGLDPSTLMLKHELKSGGNYIARFQQYWNDIPVWDAEIQLVSRAGRILSLRNRTVSVSLEHAEPVLGRSGILERIVAEGGASLTPPRIGIFQGRWAYRLRVRYPADVCELTVDGVSGQTLLKRSLLHFERTGSGLVFYPNPIGSSGDVTLSDDDDVATEFLNDQRVRVALSLLDETGYLRNRYVDLTASDIDMDILGGNGVEGYTPGSARWEDGDGVFDYDRDDFRFEEVNVYYWMTRASRYIAETLGYPEAVNYSIPVHAHYMYQDNSFYSETDRGLHFGDGGVDDAEDAEIVLHEMGHAIIHNLIPGFGGSWEAASMDEGISDYIAASISDDAHFPDTIGEWDATSYDLFNDNPPRLRPIVTDRLYPENMGDPYPLNGSADIHWDGVLWSSTLWQIREHIGALEMDTILFQGLPTFSSDTSFSAAALRLINAGMFRYGTQFDTTIRYFFTKRGILDERYVENPVVESLENMLVFPYINENSDWNTKLVVLNPGESGAQALIQVVGDNGCLIYPEETMEMSANGRFVWLPLKGRVQSPCWVVVTSDVPLQGYAQILDTAHTRGSFIPAVRTLSDQLIVEHIAPEVDYWDTRSTLVNVSDETPVVQFTVPSGESVNMDPLGSPFAQVDLDWLTDVYGGEYPDEFPGWGVVESEFPVLTGVEFFRKKGDGIQQQAGLMLGSKPQEVLYMPHVHVEGNYWWSGIALVNPQEDDTNITIQAYDTDGMLLSSVDKILEGNSKLVSLVQNIWTDSGFDFPEDTAWLKIIGTDGDLTGSFLFGTLKEKGDRLLAGISLAREPATRLVWGHISTDPEYWTGISFINTAGDAAQITVQALDNTGVVLLEETWLELMKAGEKHVSLAKDLFAGGLPVGTTQIRIVSDQPLVGFQLWGNLEPEQDYICGMLAFPAGP